MPDYAACTAITCPARHNCARYLMAWGERQDAATYDPEACRDFWPAEHEPWPLVTAEEADARAERMTTTIEEG